MAELRDSSLLFSLESLKAEERTRVADERREKERRQRADEEARKSQVRIRASAEALAVARERERLAEEERRRAEEAARLDAIQSAELERVRGETQRRAELERREAERRHELELARIHDASGARTARFGMTATSVLAFVACAALGYLELAVHPAELAKLEATAAATTRAERARAELVEISYKTSEAKRLALETRVKDLEAAGAQIPPAAPKVRTPPSRPSAPGSKPQRPSVRPPPCKDDNDPLNPCLGG